MPVQADMDGAGKKKTSCELKAELGEPEQSLVAKAILVCKLG
jgi:hypothetical protein